MISSPKHVRTTTALALALAAAGGISAPTIAQPAATARPAHLDTTLTPQARAKALVGLMTLEEKALQMGNNAPAIARLGVPEYNWWNEGLHGVARAGIATVFPQAIGLAATFDTNRMRSIADTISTEFRAKYAETLHPNGGSGFYQGLTVWSPNINIFRDPRWGRGQETYGEDPYLTGEIGTAFIHGLQGDDPKFYRTIATSKHYAVHSGPESNRHRENVAPSPHDLEDTYLPAFRKTVVDGKVGSVMCAYNAVEGVPACASDFLMEKRLREDWGFKGFVVSDCGGAANIYRKDALHYVDDPVKGVALGIKAGMDLICGDYRNNMTTEPENIVAAVKTGALDQATLDRALVRLFEARIRLGMFDPRGSLPFATITAKDYDTPANRAKSLDMARASMVLLKNEGDLLPLNSAPKRIAVIGPNADSLDILVGNYYGTPSQPVTILAGLRARFPQSQIDYVQGTGLIGPQESAIPADAFCLDPACTQKGLKAEHFAGANLEGAPTATATEDNATVAWRSKGRETSIRWTGWLVAPETGSYNFRFASENGYRVYIADKLIVDEWGVGDAPSILSGSASLEAGKRYPIRVEAFQRGQRGEQRLVWSRPSDDGRQALEAARQANLIIFAGGLSARIEGEEMKVKAEGFAGGDRTSLDLPAPQQKLLEALQATGKPVVLILSNGSALGVNWADQHVPAIIESWYPGGEGGHAVAGLIAGDYSPAGRLPVTFYRSVNDLPPFEDYSMARRTYRYFGGEVLYPFGYGLSYTSFTYADPKASADAKVNAGAMGHRKVSVNVSNSGGMDGEEVVQLYVSRPDIKGAPIRELKGFQRIALAKGATRTVTFDLDDRALSTVGADGVRRLVPGKAELWIGGGQPGARAGLKPAAGVTMMLTVTRSAVLPK